MTSQISSISCRFVLWDAVSRTKYCCSLEVKIFGPSQNFGLATLLLAARPWQVDRIYVFARGCFWRSAQLATVAAKTTRTWVISREMKETKRRLYYMSFTAKRLTAQHHINSHSKCHGSSTGDSSGYTRLFLLNKLVMRRLLKSAAKLG